MVKQKEYNAEKGARLRKAVNYIVYKENLTTKQDVAKLLDKDYSNLSKALKGDPSYIDTYIEALCSKYELFSKDWLESGVGNLLKEEPTASDSSKVDSSPSDFVTDENAVLYHYTSLSGFMGIIGDEMIRFSDLRNSNDLRESLNKCGYKYACFCLGNKNTGFDKPRMWAQYGDNNNGVCIGFNLNKLIDFNKGKNFEHFHIKYKQSQELKFGDYNTKESLKHKQSDWMQENEYRFISNSEDGLYFNKNCIDSIYAGWNIRNLDLMEKVGVNSKIKGFMLVSGIQEGLPINVRLLKEVIFNSIKMGKAELRMKDVNEAIGRINARKYREQLSVTNVKLLSNYEELIRENERLKATIESLKKEKSFAHWEERASDVAESKGELSVN